MKLIQSVQETTPQSFFVNKGLYETYSFGISDLDKIVSIVFCEDSVDCFCPECGEKSIFKPDEVRLHPMGPGKLDTVSFGLNNYEAFNLRFTCTRIKSHKMTVNMLLNNGILTKIGQSPSYADINIQGVERFKRILPNDLLIEFKKSIGLHAHGVGAGSVVYLRRIIEKFMIDGAYQKARSTPGWDDRKYQESRVKDRIILLKEHLPEMLVNNTVIYSIVSKGIHELSEYQCIEYYPVLRSFIEVVLMDMLTAKETEETRRKLKESINSIGNDLK